MAAGVAALPLYGLGRLPYGQALALQHALRARLQQPGSSEPGFLLSLQHDPVVTLGKRGRAEHLLAPALLRAHGVDLFKVDRGGEATFHGPGQLVLYPILHLERLGLGVVDVIRDLAAAICDTLATYGVAASYDKEHPGVWTQDGRKVASVGMRVSGGVSTHGVAVNLDLDLTGFSLIVPCGMPDAPITRLADLVSDDLRGQATPDAFLERLLPRLPGVFGAPVSPQEPGSMTLPSPGDWVESLPLEDS
jgi:lipoate-protein ligase B